MDRKRKVYLAKTAVVLGAIPVVLWAYEFGPEPGYCGVPGETASCATAGCHTGTANTFSGSVKVTFPSGLTYSPGVKQHLTVTIADPAATQKLWGFQLTARRASSPSTQAGTFASTDQFTTVMCSHPNLQIFQESDFNASLPQTCPASETLQYAEHSRAGTQIPARLQTGSMNYEFDWNPPATNVGDIVIYVAGNAANGDNQNSGDHIYTAKYTLTPAAAGGAPAISQGGVVSAGAFGGFTSLAPGSWMEIYGSNLASGSRQWAGSDFNGVNAPTSLDGVKVTIGGKSAFVDFISSGQVNAQVPSDVTAGQVVMTVTNPDGTSSPYTITVNALQPGLLAPPAFNISGKQYAVAQFADGSFVLPPRSIAGLTTRQAKPGETIVIYGIGFGPVLTASNGSIPAGQIVTSSNELTNPLKIQFGSAPATLVYQGLAPNFVGLYQFNVTVPAVADSDLVPLTFTLNGTAGAQTLFTAVKQ